MRKHLIAAVLATTSTVAIAANDGFYFRMAPGKGEAVDPGAPPATPALPKAFPVAPVGLPPTFSMGEDLQGTFAAGGGSVGQSTFTATGLPDGVSLSPAGVLSGRMSTPGTYVATIIATDADGKRGGTNVTFEVRPPAPSIAVGTTPGTVLVAGLPFSATPSLTNAGVVATWSLAEGPGEWLSVMPSTGMVHGIPPMGTSRFSYSIVGTDAYGRTSRASDEVALAQPYIRHVLQRIAVPGDALSGGLTSNLPGATYTAPARPGWLSLDAEVGTLSGTVPVTGFNNGFQAVARSGSAIAVTDVELFVEGVTVTSTLPAAVMRGRPVSGTLAASIRTGWAWSLANKPAWLSVDESTGRFTGTPGADANSATGIEGRATRNGVTVSSAPFGLAIVDPSVSLSPAPASELVEGSTLYFTASTNVQNPTYAVLSAPAGSYANAAGGISINAGETDVDQDYAIVVTADNGTINGSTSFPLRVLRGTVDLAPFSVRAGASFTRPLATNMLAAGRWTVTSDPFLAAPPSALAPAQASTSLAGSMPVSGSFNLTATFKADGNMAEAKRTVAVQVLPALTLASQPVDQLFIMQTDRTAAAPSVSGKSGTLTYSLLKGGAPYPATSFAGECPGLTFSNTDGGIRGAGTATCSVADLSLQVKDDGNGVPGAEATVTSTAKFKVTVDPNELYRFTSHTFTPCGLSGRQGPTLADCRTAYASTTWAKTSTYYAVDGSGKQTWTVPATGNYTFTVQGAAGGSNGGFPAVLQGTFALTSGDKITLIAGQTSAGLGGGGASAIYKGTTPLLVAGGGGGGKSGGNANLTTNGGDSIPNNNGCTSGGNQGGVNGSGGSGACEAGGGGWTGSGGNGGNGYFKPTGGATIGPNGTALGGLRYNPSPDHDGGFGGGGGAGYGTQGHGGGGGGYSGGSGGTYNLEYRPSGGGGSFVAASAASPQKSLATGKGAGFVTVSR